MRVHVLEREQWLPVRPSEAWSFFSSPRNLGLITPPEMRFVIHPPFNDEPVFAGQRIRYTVRPLFGIPLAWETLISRVEPERSFTDEQSKGPYSLWRHTHTFTAQGDGTLMHDKVEYALPLGPLGTLAHVMLVKRKVEAIFDYRKTALETIFGKQAA